MKQSTARAQPRSSLHMLRIVALALMLVLARGGDGGSDCPAGDCPASDCPASDCPATDCPATDCPATDCPATHTPDTQGTENICGNDTRCLENCATNDTQCTQGTCCDAGPQMHHGFNDGCQTDSNPCCIEYRFGDFVYYDPLWTSNNIFAFNTGGAGTYVPPAMPASSRGGYSSQAATRPDWETREWTCTECHHVNHPCYNPTICGECDAERPAQEQPTQAPEPANVDPLTIQSATAPENDRQNTCCVCMERVSDIVLLGPRQGGNGLPSCRHKCMCRQCAHMMRQSGHARCPMCRTKVEQFAVVDSMPQNMQQTIYT